MPENQGIDLSKLRIQHENPAPSSYEPKKKRSPLLFGLLAVVILAAIFIVYKISATPGREVEAVGVTLLTPSTGSSLLTASGYVVAQRKAEVASKATGRLVFLGYREGDKVKKGDVIARIESSDMEAALAQAKANLGVAHAELNDASQSLDRVKKMFARNLASQADVDAGQFRYDRVIASIASTEAGVEAAKVNLENTFIRAPFDGTILTKNADVGEVVAPFAAGASSRVAVVTLADMSSLEVEADVSESNLEKVSINQPCEISLDAYPDRKYKGSVAKIVPTADRAKATVMTKIKFDKLDNYVLPEMSCKARFLTQTITNTEQQIPIPTIPLSAMTTRNGKRIVFVINDNRITETPVETGEISGQLVEIKNGVSVNDKIVNKPTDDLQSGMKVKIKG
ncbi:MAG: efflux RND transporter periplasmic adaptor subunit [Bacteroidota bacterium]